MQGVIARGHKRSRHAASESAGLISAMLGGVKLLRVLHTMFLSCPGCPDSDLGFNLVEVLGKLAGMGAQSGELLTDHRTDVDRKIRGRRAREVDLAYFVRFQIFFQQFGKIPAILRCGIDRGNCGYARREMIGMIAPNQIIRCPATIWRLANYARWPVLTKRAHDVAT